MKTYLFDTDDFVLISYLKSETPEKIWWTPIQYVFEYEDFYIEAEIYCCENPSENTYIMSVKFEKVNGKYTNINGCIVVSENRKISNIYIVRTLVYSQNLVDVGLLINIENDFIDAFVKDNDDDFYKVEDDYLLENFDFKHLPKEYEYIIFE
ncbi:hypothetical protein [Flavobacterium sp. WC2430]|uniref:hypothetical protein n=1 Tax=Flavobacterium sp. WC2430 TaxID=3234137 RepID=UPI0034671A4A